MFGSVKIFGSPHLLGTSFIDKCKKGILPTGQDILLSNFLPVPILVVHEATNVGATKQIRQPPAVPTYCKEKILT